MCHQQKGDGPFASFLNSAKRPLRQHRTNCHLRMTNMEVMTRARLTCPECGFADELEMPTDSCQFFQQCAQCKTVLRPEPGDCCVFCSYGDVPCPSMQGDEAA